MSWISKLLGLDNRPTILKALNEAGHTLGTVALEAIPESDVKGRLGAAIDQVTAKVVNAVPAIPQEEGGLAKIYLADEMKSVIFSELDRYEPVAAELKVEAEAKAPPEKAQSAASEEAPGTAHDAPQNAASAGGFGQGTFTPEEPA